jgi:hypothetical protein
VHSTNTTSAFIEVAEDCAVELGTVPPERTPATVARLQYEMLADAPYRFTSDEVVFGVHAARAGVSAADMDAARATFFSKGQPCLRSSPLPKTYGWGFHFDDLGRVALVALGSPRYGALAADESLAHLRAMRRSRGR